MTIFLGILIVCILIMILLVLVNIAEQLKLSNHNRVAFETQQLNKMESIRNILKHFDKI